jgi:hypothetical protein
MPAPAYISLSSQSAQLALLARYLLVVGFGWLAVEGSWLFFGGTPLAHAC